MLNTDLNSDFMYASRHRLEVIAECADWYVECRNQYVLCRMQGGKCKEPSDSMDKAFQDLCDALKY